MDVHQPGVGHGNGRDKCWNEISRKYYIGRVASSGVRRDDLQKFLNSCEVCNVFGAFNNKPPTKAIMYNEPRERLQIDLKDWHHKPHGDYKYVLRIYILLLFINLLLQIHSGCNRLLFQIPLAFSIKRQGSILRSRKFDNLI